MHGDPLAPARGCLLGCLLGILSWFAFVAAVVALALLVLAVT